MLIEELYKNKPHLYLDMDGVQADFFGDFARRYHDLGILKSHDQNKVITQFAHSSPEEVYDFFRNLPMLKGGVKIISWLKKHNIPYTILSAPLRGPYADASIQAKKDWLDQHHPGTSSSALFTSNKYIHAKSHGHPNVLVDDHGPYLADWEKAGGIIVHHDDNHVARTIDELERIYFPKK